MHARAASGLTFLVLLAAFAGCLRVGPGSDLHLVCERESTSPFPPYTPRELAGFVRQDPPMDRALANAIFPDLAERILHAGGAPYPRFEANLSQDPTDGRWLFFANGTDAAGTDTYALVWPFPDERVEPPARYAEAARRAVANESATKAWGAQTGVTWTRELPGCVRAEHPEGAAWVNVDKDIVVSLEETPPGGRNA